MADNKFNISELIDDDTTPIDTVIGKLKDFQGVMSQLAGISEKNAAQYSQAINTVVKSASSLDTEIEKLDATLKTHQDLIVKGADKAERLVATHAVNVKGYEDEAKAAAAYTENAKQLQKAQDDLSKSTSTQAKTMGDLKAQLAAATKEAKDLGTASDAAIPDDAIKKVEDLSKKVNTASSAIKNSKKVVEDSGKSYNQLKAEVENATKELKAMEGGIGSNSARFKMLESTVKDGNEKLKEFDKNLGASTESTKGQEEALGALDEATGGAVSGVKKIYEGFKLLLTSPIGVFLLAIGAAVAALTEYFTGSVEGQDEFNKVVRAGEAILKTFTSYLEEFGKLLFEAISKPKESLQALWDIAKPVRDAVVAIFEDPLQAVEDLGQAIVDNIINRVKSIAVLGEAVNKIIEGDLTGGFKKLADAGIQAVSGITNGTDKIVGLYNDVKDAVVGAFNAINEEAQRRLAIAEKIAALENQLKKDRIADIVDDAKTELAVYQQLNKAQDKLKFSANERFAAEKAAGKLLEDQLLGDLKLAQDEIKLQKLLIENGKDNYENRQKLAELQAAEIGLQSAFEKAFKKRQATERQLLEEAERDRLASIKRIEDAERLLNETILKGRIESNKDLIADTRTGFEERNNLITENYDLERELLQSQLNDQLSVAKEAAIARVDIDADTLDQIYSNQEASADEINALRRAAAEEALKTDVAYNDEVTRLNEQFAQSVDNVNQATIQSVANNVFKQLESDYHHLLDSIDQKAAEEAIGLTDALTQGNISYKEYANARAKLQEESQAQSLKSQIAYLEKVIAQNAQAGYDTSELDAQLAGVKLQLSDTTNAKLIEGEQKLQQGIKQLQQAGFDTAVSVMNSLFESQDADREARLEALSTQYENETTLAGDNDAKKLELQNAYNLEKDKIDKEQKAADRKKAIFQKSLALVEIAINTAKGIGLALGTYPPPVSFALAAVTAVLGALQVAAVLAKPIPAFAQGTDSAPGGLAIVNDGNGPELVVGRSGARIYNSDGPALVSLDKGDRVYTAQETTEILRDGDRLIAGFDDETQKLKYIRAQSDVDIMAQAIGGRLDALIDVTKDNRPRKADHSGLAREIARGLSLSLYEASEYQ